VLTKIECHLNIVVEVIAAVYTTATTAATSTGTTVVKNVRVCTTAHAGEGATKAPYAAVAKTHTVAAIVGKTVVTIVIVVALFLAIFLLLRGEMTFEQRSFSGRVTTTLGERFAQTALAVEKG
jgi:uncharacterized membrane protein